MTSPATGGLNRRMDVRTGYYFAVLNAIISGLAIYINSQGVKMFSDSTLYTGLKNAVVGVALVIPFFFMANSRAELKRLTGRQWGLLALLAVIGGSVPYALFFRGLQLTTPVTSSLLNHAQFLIVALLAILFLGERLGVIIWFALIALLVGTTLGSNLHTLVWNEGTVLVALSTLLFAAGVVLAKRLLSELSTLTVMAAKMSAGSAMLLAYVAATGHLGAVASLTTTQWEYVLVTGLILLAFTFTAFMALRHATATVATAIPAAAPLITTLLTVVAAPHITLAPVNGVGLFVIALATAIIIGIGMRREATSTIGVPA